MIQAGVPLGALGADETEDGGFAFLEPASQLSLPLIGGRGAYTIAGSEWRTVGPDLPAQKAAPVSGQQRFNLAAKQVAKRLRPFGGRRAAGRYLFALGKLA